MKNFKNVMKKVTVVMLVLALFASIAGNVYQYVQLNQTVDCAEEVFGLLNDACLEAKDNMSISDKIMFEHVLERNCSDENLEEIVNKYYLIK